ncbi:MAG: protocatechuate 3,4-dioxygenase subunit alpha [Pseudomonadota bacterium]
MVQPLGYLAETPSQTAGPYVHIGCMPNFVGNAGIYSADLSVRPFPNGAPGTRISVTGRVLDGLGTPLRDAMLEGWQAGADGTFGPGSAGHSRFAANFQTGEWRLETIKPGPVPMEDGRLQAPHISIWIVARGINIGLATRIYFDDDDHSGDPLMARIEHKDRAATLIAKSTGDREYAHDIRLQGERETIFLDI